jgi:Concanavalin A-like lectin/glucanases superfamily
MLIRRVPWTRQPQGPVGIDWSNPLARGLTFCHVGTRNVELVMGQLPTTAVGSGTVGRHGRSIAYDGSAAKLWYDANTYPSAGDASVFALATVSSIGADQSILTKNGASNIALNFGIENTSGKIFNYRYDSTSGSYDVYSTSSALTLSAGETATIGVTNGPNLQSQVILYKNGVGEVASATAGANRVVPEVTDAPLSVGAYSAGSGFFSGQLFVVYRWGRILSQSEMAQLHANSWQLLAPRRIYIPTAAAAGGAPTTFADLKAVNITSSSVQATYDYTF